MVGEQRLIDGAFGKSCRLSGFFGGILEDRVRVRVLGGKQPCYYVKIWLGIAEYSELPARHEEIRRRVGEALLTCTGVPARRVDLVFYTARTESAHMEGGDSQ